ncbi:MAG: hypothetical protein AB7F67_18815 [Rhodospirillaceae bacterium]
MAICWTSAVTQLDNAAVLAPERYSTRRSALSVELRDTVALTDLARLVRITVNPAHRNTADQPFIVLDTTHAVEGRIYFSGAPTMGAEVGSVKRPLANGNVIVSRLRTYLKQIALVDDELLQRFKAQVVCSTEFYILEPKEPGEDIAFLVPFLLSDSVQTAFKQSQEGGHHPRIHQSVLMDLRLPNTILRQRNELSLQLRSAIRETRKGEEIFASCANKITQLILG